ncbi:hypothetical protein ABZ348_20525 [Streptomyces sp. NPDC005963]|uniref:hypothetical protein n=1 Tax=Streptomyces sp. NPDC005963 TaxID=3156721 RepID=UPI00340DED08
MTVVKLMRKPTQTDSGAEPAAKQVPLENLKKPLPAGQPRDWYVTHNRRLKAMRLAIALLDSGVYHPATADNRRIRAMADQVGIHPPSDTTCRMVRALIRYGR